MAGVRFRVDLDDGQVRAALGRLIAAAGDLAPAMDEIGGALVASTRLRFERGVGPDGRAWPPSLRVKTEGGLTLVDQGHLKDSINHDYGADWVVVGSNRAYAAIHQLGGTIRAKAAPYLQFKVGGRWARKKQVTIPPRPYLGVDGDDRAAIAEILGDHLYEATAP